MTVAAIRKKLHEYLDTADDRKIKAMYTLLESEIEEHTYSDKFIATLEERETYYKTGGKMINAEEAEKTIDGTLENSNRSEYLYTHLQP